MIVTDSVLTQCLVYKDAIQELNVFKPKLDIVCCYSRTDIMVNKYYLDS